MLLNKKRVCLLTSDATRRMALFHFTQGYGDVTPSTNEGKIAVAMYAILVSNVVGGLLQPARVYLESLCHKNISDDDKKQG